MKIIGVDLLIKLIILISQQKRTSIALIRPFDQFEKQFISTIENIIFKIKIKEIAYF